MLQPGAPEGYAHGDAPDDASFVLNDWAPASIRVLIYDDSTTELGWHIYRHTATPVPRTAAYWLAFVPTLNIAAASGGSNPYIDTDVVAGTTYHYAIVAVNCQGRYDAGEDSHTAPGGGLTAPTSLTAVGGDTTIDLAWTDNASGEEGYQVERESPKGSGFALVHTTAANAESWQDTGRTNGVEYNYRVRAFDSSPVDVSAYSNEAAATANDTAGTYPAAPGWRLGGTEDGGDNTITVLLEDLSNNEDDIYIYGSETSGFTPGAGNLLHTFSRSAGESTAVGEDLEWDHTGLDHGDTWYYRISAENTNGETFNAEQVSRTASVGTPGNTVASVEILCEDVKLTWSLPTGTLTGFSVYRKPVGDDEYPAAIHTSATTPTTWTDTTSAANTDYHYEVRFYNDNGEGSGTMVLAQTSGNPTNVSIGSATQLGRNQVRISWSGGGSATNEMRIWRRLGTEGSGTQIVDEGDDEANDGSYVDSALGAGLGTPASVAISSVDDTNFLVTWTNSGDSGDAIVVDLKVGAGGSFVEYAVLANTNLTQQVVLGLDPSTYHEVRVSYRHTDADPWQWQVQAVGPCGNSNVSAWTAPITVQETGSYSNTPNATTLALQPPQAPSSVLAFDISPDEVTGLVLVTWIDEADSESGYAVDREIDGGGWVGVAPSLAEGAEQWQDSGATIGAEHQYRVRATNAAGASANVSSNLVTPGGGEA